MKLCLSLFSIFFGLVSFAQPLITLDSTTVPLCYNSQDGAIYITISGGIAPYAIDWSNDGLGDNDDPEDLIGISGGLDTCIVTDSNLDTDTLFVNLIAPLQIQFSYISNQPECCGYPNGSFEITASGGTPNYTYSIDDFATSQSSGFFDGLYGGLYEMDVIDANGCVNSVFSAISSSFVMNISLTANSTCEGTNNGEITTFISGGCGTLLFDWDIDGTGDYDDTQHQTGLSPGTYTIQVTNIEGCYATETITVGIDSTSLEVEIDSVIHNICLNAAQGEIHPTILNGTAPFIFDWSYDGLGDANDSLALDNLAADDYTLVIIDDMGCTDTLYQTINDGTIFIASITQNESLLSANETGTYQWVNCPGFDAIVGANDDTFITNQNGMYAVIIQNMDGCIDTSDCVSVEGIGFSETSNSFITIYPNPTMNGFTTVQCNLADANEVSISDIHGRIVLTQAITSAINIIDVRNFEKGVYLLQIDADNINVIERLIIE